ncbi:Short-chain dehydrogenase/reductase family protein [Mycena kentingensis (nom. inval.)]|nr:Short-chain dehydrogenase/reductase family protein [Mycena kentingensis (nom. inval.)]
MRPFGRVLAFFHRVLLSASARVYFLRVLLLADLIAIVLLAWLAHWGDLFVEGAIPLIVTLIFAVLVLAHHVLSIFPWWFQGPYGAFSDCAFILGQIGLFGYFARGALSNVREKLALFGLDDSTPYLRAVPTLLSAGKLSNPAIGFIVLFACSLIVPITLGLLFVLRVATIVRSPEPFLEQSLNFLGGCSPSSQRYTPATILFTRGLARPLVRGESVVIILIRCITILALGVLTLAFTLYTLVVIPATITVYTREIVQPPNFDIGQFVEQVVSQVDGPALIRLALRRQHDVQATGNVTASVRVPNNNTMLRDFPCDSNGAEGLITCSSSWTYISTITIPLGEQLGRLYLATAMVAPWYQRLPDDPSISGHAFYDKNEPTTRYTQNITIIEGLDLYVHLVWVARRRIDNTWSLRPEISSVQTIPRPANATASTRTTLIIGSSGILPTRYYEDVRDTSLFSGIANIGGFWTFVDGAFALLFGANFIYFAFRRRPLSALGIIHVFQRSGLTRRWHEDFPAVESEGGLPGSENAGIVAFIRERLVDVGSDARQDANKEKIGQV